jgi:hypothetical protein
MDKVIPISDLQSQAIESSRAVSWRWPTSVTVAAHHQPDRSSLEPARDLLVRVGSIGREARRRRLDGGSRSSVSIAMIGTGRRSSRTFRARAVLWRKGIHRRTHMRIVVD